MEQLKVIIDLVHDVISVFMHMEGPEKGRCIEIFSHVVSYT